ncbi:MAG: ATP-binding cassette domain-containing protein, partial [Methylococcaceae bacterium]|nr:ATP-binding cassette domain-containing protein [Methylococcaceae bacterium]
MHLEVDVRLPRGQFYLKTDLPEDGRSMGILGSSGSGKSTLLGLIAGSITPDSGRIALGGEVLYDGRKGVVVPPEQRSVAAVLQHDPAKHDSTVRETLEEGYGRAPKPRRHFKLGVFIDALELGGFMQRTVAQLSAGERRRVAFAHALAQHPSLLLLDDAFSGIGKEHREGLMSLLRPLQAELAMPVVYASSSLAEIAGLGEDVAIIDGGRVVRMGSLRTLARERGMLRYLGLSPVDNLIQLRVDSHDVEGGCTLASLFGAPFILPLRPGLQRGSDVNVSIRSSDIALSRQYLSGISIQNQLKGRVCAIIPSGDKAFVQVDCGVTLLAEVTTRACLDLRLKEGDSVYCLIKAHAVRYLAELDA